MNPLGCIRVLSLHHPRPPIIQSPPKTGSPTLTLYLIKAELFMLCWFLPSHYPFSSHTVLGRHIKALHFTDEKTWASMINDLQKVPSPLREEVMLRIWRVSVSLGRPWKCLLKKWNGYFWHIRTCWSVVREYSNTSHLGCDQWPASWTCCCKLAPRPALGLVNGCVFVFP